MSQRSTGPLRGTRFEQVLIEARSMTVLQREATWTLPVIVMHEADLAATPHDFLTSIHARPNRGSETSESHNFIQAAPSLVFEIKKRNAARPFQERIFVGRSAGTDITLRVRGLSKSHCYFRRGDASWHLADAGSRNGTFLRNRRLEKGEEVKLDDCTPLRLGELEVLFLSTTAFHDLVSRSS